MMLWALQGGKMSTAHEPSTSCGLDHSEAELLESLVLLLNFKSQAFTVGQSTCCCCYYTRYLLLLVHLLPAAVITHVTCCCYYACYLLLLVHTLPAVVIMRVTWIYYHVCCERLLTNVLL